MIQKTALVSNYEPQEFYDNLKEWLNEFKDYEVEVQYQTSALINGKVQFSALVLAR